MIKASDGTDIETLLSDIEKHSSQLSDWELQFIDDINHKLRHGYSLSPKQIEKIESIWENVT
jgi:hypothetical protein